MALLDNLRYDGGSNATAMTAAAEEASLEGKFGIPCFNGEPAALQEYLYRVRARAAREALMDTSEVKKLGPLGLRLLEGLRGSAFKLAQQLSIEDLGKKDGHEQLLGLLERSLKPRKGTNGYYYMETCLDCNKVLKRQKKTGAPTVNPIAEGYIKEPAFCRHHHVTWRGSNGINWRNVCLDCGKVTKGRWDDKTFPGTGAHGRPPLPAHRDFLQGAIGQPVTDDKFFSITTIQEIVRSAVIVGAILRMRPLSHRGLHRGHRSEACRLLDHHLSQVQRPSVISSTSGARSSSPLASTRANPSMSDGAYHSLLQAVA